MLMFDRIGSTLLFGIAANSDNLTVGIAYGAKRRRIRWEQNLVIAVVTTAITLIALAAGRQIREVLPAKLPDVLGGVLLIALAAWSFYWERAGAGDRSAKPIDRFAMRRSVGIGETLVLSGSLSINNIGLAIAGGISGVGYGAAAAAIFGLSIVMLALGQAIGTNIIRLTSASRVLRFSLNGNVVLALAGGLMIAGY
jgi:putative Mn2+ efflux pump MntP